MPHIKQATNYVIKAGNYNYIVPLLNFLLLHSFDIREKALCPRLTGAMKK